MRAFNRIVIDGWITSMTARGDRRLLLLRVLSTEQNAHEPFVLPCDAARSLTEAVSSGDRVLVSGRLAPRPTRVIVQEPVVLLDLAPEPLCAESGDPRPLVEIGRRKVRGYERTLRDGRVIHVDGYHRMHRVRARVDQSVVEK